MVSGAGSSVLRHLNVSTGKIISHEEQRLAQKPGKRIRKAIAEVETSGMSSLAEATEGGASEGRVISGEGDDLDMQPLDQMVEFSRPLRTTQPLGDDACLHERRRRESE